MPASAAPLVSGPLSPNDPIFLSLDPNTGLVGIGSISNTNEIYEQYLTVTTRTNSPQGYSLHLTMADNNTCLRHNDYIDSLDYEASTPCDSVPSDYKIVAGDPNNSMINNTWGYSVDAGITYIAPQPLGTTTAIKSTNIATDSLGDPTTITFGAKKGNPQSDPLTNGDYSGQLILSAFANKPAAPTITSVSPASGTTAVPGATLTINGANLSTAFQVTVDGNACTSTNIVSNTQITCVIPAGTPSVAVSVEVTTWGGVATATFTYSTAPTFTSMSPNAYPTRRSDTLAKFTPAVTITTGGGSTLYTTAVWFDLDGDGQRAADSTEDCTITSAAANSIACTAPPVLDIYVTTTRAYRVCFTVLGFSSSFCLNNAFTYYYDTTPPALSINNTSTNITNNNTHSSAVDIPISMTGSGTVSNSNYNTSLSTTSSDKDNGGVDRANPTVICEIAGVSGTSCSSRTFPSIGTYVVTYTARDLAYNYAVLTRTYTTYKEYEYGIAQGETKTFSIADLDLGTSYAVRNIQFGVWGGGGGGGATYKNTGSDSSSGGGGGGGFAGANLATANFPATFTATTIGSGGSAGTTQGANGQPGNSSTGSYSGSTFTASGGSAGLAGSNNGSTSGTLIVSGGSGSISPAITGGLTGSGGQGGVGIGLLWIYTSSEGGSGGGSRGAGAVNTLNTCSTGAVPGGGGTGAMHSTIFTSGVRAGCAGAAGRISLYWRHYPSGHPSDGAMP